MAACYVQKYIKLYLTEQEGALSSEAYNFFRNWLKNEDDLSSQVTSA